MHVRAKKIPYDRICPICGKGLEVGVLERSQELAKMQGGTGQIVSSAKTRSFIEGVNLAEVMSAICNTGVTTKKTLNAYYELCSKIGCEGSFCETLSTELSILLNQGFSPAYAQTLMDIKNGNFSFDLPGGDGEYGKLRIGMKTDYESYRSVPKQFDAEQLGLL